MRIQTTSGTIVELTPGEMSSFTAKNSFSLPTPSGINASISAGSEMFFDGSFFSYGGSPPSPLPQFQGAIRAEWVVPTDDYEAGDNQATARVAANIQMRAADGGNPMHANNRRTTAVIAQAEEMEVQTSFKNHAAGVREGNKSNYRRQPGRVVVAADQEGVEVRSSFKTAADRRKTGGTQVTGNSIGEALAEADKVTIDAGRGRTRDEMLAEMPDEEREAYLNQLEVRKSTHFLGVGAQQAPEVPKVVRTVKTAKTQKSEGISAQVSVGGGVDTFDASSGSGGRGEVTETYVEGIKITNTNGPKKAQKTQTISGDPRRTIAKSICADFPDNYDFDASVKKKIARLQADFEDRPDVIRAVAAADTDPELRNRLLEEFPEAFAA